MDFVKELQQNNGRSIDQTLELIDVDSEKVKSYPEYKDAAILCKCIYLCEEGRD